MTELQAKFLELSPAVEAIALEEYRQATGGLLRCGYLCGYDKRGDGSDDYACDVIVRVTKGQDKPNHGLMHWNSEWLDPYWDVEVVYWVSKPININSVWIDGPSHNMLTGVREWNHVRPISRVDYWKLRTFGIGKEDTP